ncbi:IDEAL domain-containing protein [Pseudalkalibacillus caeni]|uniref:IDEAL domain-containing protein n=1 Tax=Exobacillus caeni TaxID=2574798 RepID=A0A5R9F0F3_9BACL|nr:IDEAL domain-containing protein [Pseudalkalibacillus caeni]TLS37092.1 IDEAL domain-containing protein [Pseudalkalibacillus caeni]
MEERNLSTNIDQYISDKRQAIVESLIKEIQTSAVHAEYRRYFLKREIDKALDARDEEQFISLSNRLKEIS